MPFPDRRVPKIAADAFSRVLFYQHFPVTAGSDHCRAIPHLFFFYYRPFFTPRFTASDRRSVVSPMHLEVFGAGEAAAPVQSPRHLPVGVHYQEGRKRRNLPQH